MLLIDDLLKAPGKALFSVFEELARKAQEEWLDDDSVKQELQQIYALLDNGKISEGEFEVREQNLLTRLEQIARVKFRDKWEREMAISDGEGQVIEASLSAKPLSDALPPEAELASDLILGDSTAENSASVQNKLSLGPDFFQALRPFLDLSESSTSQDVTGLDTEGARPHGTSLLIDSADLCSSNEPTIATVNIVSPSPAQSPETPLRAETGKRESSKAPYQEPCSELPRAAANNYSSSPEICNVTAGASTLNTLAASTVGFSGAVESAMQALSVTKLKSSSVTAVVSTEDGWQVSVELVERKAIPDTSDLLGVYEVHVNKAGVVTRYERTRLRRRSDLSR